VTELWLGLQHDNYTIQYDEMSYPVEEKEALPLGLCQLHRLHGLPRRRTALAAASRLLLLAYIRRLLLYKLTDCLCTLLDEAL
jgi:hypothetical protein